MILETRPTFSMWISYIRKELNITGKKSCLETTGIHLPTMNNWESENSLPQTKALFRLINGLSQHTGECPSDILDTIVESIPEWRQIKKNRKRLQRNNSKRKKNEK